MHSDSVYLAMSIKGQAQFFHEFEHPKYDGVADRMICFLQSPEARGLHWRTGAVGFVWDAEFYDNCEEHEILEDIIANLDEGEFFFYKIGKTTRRPVRFGTFHYNFD